MRTFAALALLMMAACATDEDGAAFRIYPGEFAATVTSLDGVGESSLTVGEDGSFEGSPESSWAECAGVLTSGELEQLADALSRADALRATDAVDPLCEAPRYEVVVSVVEGAWAGQQNRFRVACNLSGPLLELTQEVVPAVFERVQAEDRCTAGLYCDACAIDDECRTIPDAICIEGFCCDAQQMMCTPELCRTQGWPP